MSFPAAVVDFDTFGEYNVMWETGLTEVYMPRLIIVRGNSGSGKSSVAKALQKEIGRNTLLISQDTVRREMLWAHDGSETTALPLLIYLLEYGYRNSEITILEGILKASWYEPLFERAMQLFEDSNI